MSSAREIEGIVGSRIRTRRREQRLTLEEFASLCSTSASTISRLETGRQAVTLRQLASIAQALGTSLETLVQLPIEEDAVIRPHRHIEGRATTWMLDHEPGPEGRTVAKVRMTAPPPRVPHTTMHPGRDWFRVLRGTVTLLLGERTFTLTVGQSGSFSTMIPHSFGATGGAAEMLTILDRGAGGEHDSMKGDVRGPERREVQAPGASS